MATNWLVYGGIAALLAAAYFFRCKIPFLNKYLCPGGEAGMPMEAPPMDQPMPLPMPMPAPMPVPGGVGAGIGMPATGVMPAQMTPVASFAKVHGVRRR